MSDLGSMWASLGIDTKGVDKASARMNSFERETVSSTDRMTSAFKKVGAAIAVYFGTRMIKNHIVEVTRLAGTYEQLGIVMTVSGKNAGYSADQMLRFEDGLKKAGIGAVEARRTLTSLATAQIDLAKSAKLARSAQDLAVVGGINSSAAFERLTYGIKSAQVEVLRTIGLNISFEQTYKDLASELGRSVNSLTNQERTQARVNGVLKEAAKYQGIYAASMTSAAKQMGSLTRHVDAYKLALGKAFQPAYLEYAKTLTIIFKGLKEIVSDPQFEAGLENIGSGLMRIATGQMVSALESVKNNTGTIVKSIERLWKIVSYDPAILEWGIVGLAVGGRKGAVILGSLGHMITWVDNLSAALGLAAAGVISYSEIAGANFKELQSLVDGFDNQGKNFFRGKIEQFNEFYDMWTGAPGAAEDAAAAADAVLAASEAIYASMTAGANESKHLEQALEALRKKYWELELAAISAKSAIDPGDDYMGLWVPDATAINNAVSIATAATEKLRSEAEAANRAAEKLAEDNAKNIQAVYDEMLKNIQDFTADTFYDLFSGNIDGWDDMLDRMYKMFLQWLAQVAAAAVIKGIVVPIVFGTSGSSGSGGVLGTSSMGGSGGSLMDYIWSGLGLAKTGTEMYYGESLVSMAYSYISEALFGTAANMAAIDASMLGTSGMVGATAGGAGAATEGLATMSSTGYGAIAAVIAAAIIASIEIMAFQGRADSAMNASLQLAIDDTTDKILDVSIKGIENFSFEGGDADVRGAASNILASALTAVEMYNTLFSYLSEESQEAIRKAMDGFELDVFDITQVASESGVENAQINTAGNIAMQVGAFFSDYIDEAMNAIQQEDIAGIMKDELLNNPKLTSEYYAKQVNAIEGGANDVVGFQKAFEELMESMRKAEIMFRSFNDFVSGESSYTEMDKILVASQVAAAAYADQLKALGIVLTDEQVQEAITNEIQNRAAAVASLNAMAKPLSLVDLAAIEAENAFNAYMVAMDQAGIDLEKLGDTTAMQAEVIARAISELMDQMWSDINGSIRGLLGMTNQLEDTLRATGTAFEKIYILLETTAGIADYTSEIEQITATLGDTANLTDEEITQLTDTLNEMTAATAQYIAMQENELAVMKSQMGIGPSGDEYRMAEINKRYGIDTAAEAQAALNWFASATLEEIKAIAEFYGIPWQQVAYDIGYMSDAFDLLGKKYMADLRKETDDLATSMEQITATLKKVKDTIDELNYYSANPSANPSDYVAQQIKNIIDNAYATQTYSAGDVELLSGLLSDWYYAASSELDAKYKQMYDEQQAWRNLLDAIDDTIRSIKYSSLNVGLPKEILQQAQLDYDTLKAAAGNSPEDMQKFEGFASTYLQKAQNVYKSSEAYQAIYASVLQDLEDLKNNPVPATTADDAYQQWLLTTGYPAEKAVIEEAFKNGADFLSIAMRNLQNDVFLKIVWENYDGTMAESLEMLESIVGQYGWDNIYTMKFVSDMADWAVANGDLDAYMKGLGFIVDATGWTSTATISYLLALVAGGASYNNVADWLATLGLDSGSVADIILNMNILAGNTTGLDTWQKVEAWVDSLGITDINVTSHITATVIFDMVTNTGTMSPDQLTEFINALIVSAYFGDGSAMKVVALLGQMWGYNTSAAFSTMWGGALGWDPSSIGMLQALFTANVPGYDQGGVATGPLSGYPATLHGTEAVIPMADGVNIPVKWMNGGMESDKPIEINLTLEIDGQPLDAKIKVIARNESENVRVNLVRWGKQNNPQRQPV